ncbi:MAG: EamA family transporter RarD, partial [Pseudomonadota bacterium]
LLIEALPSDDGDRRTGIWFALTAHGLWGVIPVYFKFVDFAGPFEIIAHRICWAMVVLVALVLIRRQLASVRHLTRRQIVWLGVSGLLLSINWSTFVWALLNERMIETSLGYYINPLVNVLLGGLFLGERLRPWQFAAVTLAGFGVLNELLAVGVFPWVGLTLAFTFGFYGLVRKKIAVDSVVGLGVETLLLLPLAIGYLLWLTALGQGSLAAGEGAEVAWLALGGPLTVIPLVAFAAAALRLPLTVLGFFQYLAPSITLLLAIFVYGEPFTSSQALTFGCIWFALVIFTAEGLVQQRRQRRSQLAAGT